MYSHHSSTEGVSENGFQLSTVQRCLQLDSVLWLSSIRSATHLSCLQRATIVVYEGVHQEVGAQCYSAVAGCVTGRGM